MSTNNNNDFKRRQKIREFGTTIPAKVNPYAANKPQIPKPQDPIQRTDFDGKPLDFLASFLIKIYADKGIGWNALNNYISLYLRDLVARDPNRSSKQLGTDRGNIMKEIYRGTMTWKNFIGKLRLIRIREIIIGVTLIDDQGRKSYHEVVHKDATIPWATEAFDDDALITIHDDDDDSESNNNDADESEIGFKM